MNIVDSSFNDGKYCLTNITMEACTEDSLPFISIYYEPGNLKMVQKCGYAGDFLYLSLSESCNKPYDREELTFNDNSDEITNQEYDSVELFTNDYTIKNNNKTKDETINIKDIKNDIINGKLDELIIKLLINNNYLFFKKKK